MSTDITFQSQELRFLSERGYIKQFTHAKELDEQFTGGKKITFYTGFDPTAPSLHIGHLIPIMIIRYLVRMGHQAIILLGSATAKIGDPSGKIQTRKMLSEDDINSNSKLISNLIKKIIVTELDSSKVIFLQNDWIENFKLVEFLRDYGKYFSVNRMLMMETFKNRLEKQQPLSFLEFSYSLFQGYDFVHLYNNYSCTLQIGGSDQWGNIVSGIDLGHYLELKETLQGMTTNLLINANGEKMGKTASGAVWLDESSLPVFDYWQYFRNVDDKDLENLMKLLTDIPLSEIGNIKNTNNINDAKIQLANAVCEIVHGKEKTESAHKEALMKFNNRSDNVINYDNLIPDHVISRSDLLDSACNEITLLAFIKLFLKDDSNSKIRTLIEQNAIRINSVLMNNFKQTINLSNIVKNKILIEVGKKKKIIVLIDD